ncbi:DUF3810 domain-containing protein [Lutibacter citreus]|uniref:DUF3810 domain-containing protein n=1 Tax=Lutibacter citreus TaxID=2138210 RepID=UPI000DBE0479|nr:DUF3810 domain-containing protein [Lutibacter citreus]
MNSNKTPKILTFLLVMQWAFIQLVAQYPSFIERYYSNGFYIYISRFYRILVGWLPFSIGDILYVIIFFILLKIVVNLFKYKELKQTFFNLGATISILFFFFHFNWALNYFRQPVNQTLNISTIDYSNEELIHFTKKLIKKTNDVHKSLVKNDSILFENNLSKKEIKANAPLAYDELAKKYNQFSYKNPSIKHSIFSIPLTYMGFAGYINPLTNEAQVNSLILKNNYPATVCHEIAHQVGYASESEANFIGFLASTHSKDIYFNYSGYLMALRYCISEVYRKDPNSFEEMKSLMNKGILKDFKQNQQFWLNYNNWTEKYFKSFYDNFLKANKQKDGIQGYSKMVVLLINYYKTESL